jgi:small subunit ribosomal protein S1
MVDPEKSEPKNVEKEEKQNQISDGKPIENEDIKSSETPNDSQMDIDEESKKYSDEEYQKYVELYDRTLRDITEGQVVEGRVLAITEKDVLVDIGFKSEGVVPLEEFENPSEVKVGDNVEVFLDTIEDTDGQLVLSKKKANFVRIWDEVIDHHNTGETIEGRCVRRIKGGIVVDLMGVDAFLPGSQIDVKPIRDFDALIGKTFTFKIVKVNKLRKNIVVSRRALLEESMQEKRRKVLVELKKGEVREGTVKNITDFGVFIDLGGVDGLLHINDLSWGRVNHPSEILELDQKVKVVVLDFNDAKDRISLGLKQLQDHPWKDVGEKYNEGSIVMGRVVSIADYGAFVELEKGVEGLIHVSEMSWTRLPVHPSKIVSIGDEVEVKVLNVDRDRKRISLGLKQLTQDPWQDIEKKYKQGSRIKGTVRNMTNFGVFVELEDNIDGLIHISDLSWTKKIKHPSEIVKKGNEIEVVILEVNKAERRLSLGYKQLTDDPWPEFEKVYQVNTRTKGKIVRFIEKGFIVEMPLGLEGFVPMSQLVETSMAKVKENYKEGDEIDLIVIEFDKENKRVILSRKRILQPDLKTEGEAEKAEVDAFIKGQKTTTTVGEMAGAESEAETESTKKPSKEKKGASKKETESKTDAKTEAKDKDEAPAEDKKDSMDTTEKKDDQAEAVEESKKDDSEEAAQEPKKEDDAASEEEKESAS